MYIYIYTHYNLIRLFPYAVFIRLFSYAFSYAFFIFIMIKVTIKVMIMIKVVIKVMIMIRGAGSQPQALEPPLIMTLIMIRAWRETGWWGPFVQFLFYPEKVTFDYLTLHLAKVTFYVLTLYRVKGIFSC